MKVLVLAEYYPRAGDPTRGIWAHRQTLATREAGAEVLVLVLHRPLPPLAALRAGKLGQASAELRQPQNAVLDGVPVRYIRYLSPPRPWSYGNWGRWAAPALGRAVRLIRREFAFDLIHAHYAVPAGDAVRRAVPAAPLVVSVHGGDVHGVGDRGAGARNVRAALGHARLTLANSAGTAARCRQHGAGRTRVVHLGTDLPARPASEPSRPLLVTVANLVARKRHADVIEAMALLSPRHPELRYLVVGDGPEKEGLRRLASERGLGSRVELVGALEHEAAIAVGRSASVFVLPSVDEAFGVAYVEAMAAGVPAVGCRGESGPEEIAACGGGIELVRPRDPADLAQTLDRLLSDPATRAAIGHRGRATVERHFTWERCGVETISALDDALAGRF